MGKRALLRTQIKGRNLQQCSEHDTNALRVLYVRCKEIWHYSPTDSTDCEFRQRNI